MTDNEDSPYRKTHAQHPRKPQARHVRGDAEAKHKKPASGGRRRKKARGRSAKRSHTSHTSHTEHTSHPTTRSAQVSTRQWLLKQYGPMCAYCGERFSARSMTLDHVAPRRGQDAYDRRDNLVLACKACNIAKRDQSPLAYLLGLRSRAMNLVKFGAHLSQGLLEMARSLVPTNTVPSSGRANIDYSKWGPIETDDDSPYRS